MPRYINGAYVATEFSKSSTTRSLYFNPVRISLDSKALVGNRFLGIMVITAVVTEEEQSLRLTTEKPKLSIPHADSSSGKAVPIKHGPGSNVDFGAEVYGIDLNNFTDADFDFIHDALHRHKLLVFKQQPNMLDPQQQYKLTSK